MATDAQPNTEGQGEGCGLREKDVIGHVQSNLHSLKKLYGLLNIVKENDLKRISSENVHLDEKERILLKKLLDGATEQALQSHSKIISRQLGACLASEELVRPGNQQTLQNNFRVQDPELICHSITTKEDDDQSQIKKTSQATIAGETEKFKFSATQSLNTWSGRRICQKCNRKRPNSAKVKKNSNGETKNPSRDRRVHENSSDKQRLKPVREIRVGLEPSSGILAEEGNRKTEKLIDVSKEVARAIQRIGAEIHVDQHEKVDVSTNDMVRVGSMIQKKDMATQTTEVEKKTDKKKSKESSLPGQMLSQTGHAVGTSRRMSRSLPRQRMSQASRKLKEPALPGPFLSQACKAVLEADELQSQMQRRIRVNKASPDPSNGCKSIKEKTESPGRFMSQSGKQPIHEKLNSPSQKAKKRKEAYKDRSPMDQMRPREKTSEIGTSKPLKPLLVVGPTLLRNESLNPHPKKTISKRGLPHQIMKRPSFRDPPAGPTRSKGSYYQEWSGTHKDSNRRRTLLPHQQKAKVIRGMDDDSDSSTWISQDTYSDESVDLPFYHEMEPTSSQDTYTSESEDPPIYHQVEPTSRKMDPTLRSRRYVPHDHIKDNSYAYVDPPDKKGHRKEMIRRWRRFKDKLAIVFHHHHHHHHHHHDQDGSDESQVRRAAPNHHRHQSVMKTLRQILHRPNKEDDKKLMAEIYGERVAKRTPRQHQQGYFHALLDGFLRHVCHSKKSNPSVRLARVPKYGKAAKKLHWWQKFRKRGVKLASSTKPRVKLGFKTKRPYLQGGKMS